MPTVQFKDYYKTLGVERTASQDEVRAAYKRLARKFHPDLNPGNTQAEERFKEVNEAHEVLVDAEKRKLYDRYGDAWRQYKEAGFTGDEPGSRGGARVSDSDFGDWFARYASPSGRSANGRRTTFTYETDFGGAQGDGRGFSDFFQTVFGGLGGFGGRDSPRPGTASRGRPRGSDIEAEVEVSFDEAYRGTTRTIQIQGSDACPTCRGTGLVRESICPTCDGTGQAAKARSVEVKIPAGVATGSKIRVKGQGGASAGGGSKGDVVLRITVKPDPRFEREGNDLRTEVEVPLYTAMLGGEVIVPTPDGRVALTIPAESQNGRVFRLRRKGMPTLRSKGGADAGTEERGDLLARVRVILPTGLDDHERSLVGQLREHRSQRDS